MCNKHTDWFDFISRNEAEHRKLQTFAEKSFSARPCMCKERRTSEGRKLGYDERGSFRLPLIVFSLAVLQT